MNKILVVEPEPVLLNLLAELLDLNGFYPLTTTSFEQGYELIKLEKPQLILCGHSSKYIHSYEACWQLIQKIRQHGDIANIPFIFMAGSDLETIHNWQNYLTRQEILLKPFNLQMFIEKIHSHLQFSPDKHKIENTQTLFGNTEYTHHNQNALITKANHPTHNYSCISA